MNQRIQSLAEFAGGIRKHYPKVWQFTDEQLEQFALMIADRCARLVQGVPTDAMSNATIAKAVAEGKVHSIVVPYNFDGIINVGK